MSGLQISVIIVNWNGREFLADCLDGLRQQVYRLFSTILVDNGSGDGSVDFVARNYPEVRIISLSENTGFCAANNVALRSVRGKYVALLNNDAVAHPFWLKNLVEALESHPQAGSAASKMVFQDAPGIIDRAGDSYTKAGAGLLRGRGVPSSRYDEMEWVFGACAGAALYRTGMLRDIGYFDEDFFLLYEDVDLSFRGQLAGYRCIYVPDAVVYHKGSRSIVHDSPVSVYYGHRNLEWVYIKNMPATLVWRTAVFHIIYNIGSLLYFAENGHIKDFLKAKRDALKGLLKHTLEKRLAIQHDKRVDDTYIWSLLEEERMFSRLACRLRRGT